MIDKFRLLKFKSNPPPATEDSSLREMVDVLRFLNVHCREHLVFVGDMNREIAERFGYRASSGDGGAR